MDPLTAMFHRTMAVNPLTLAAAAADEPHDENKRPSTPSSQSSTPRWERVMDGPSHDSHILETISIEEFEARFAARRLEREGNGLAARAVRSPNILAPRSMNHAARSAPVPTGKPRTAEHVMELYRLVQENKLAQPELTYTTVGIRGVEDFGARLTLYFQVDVEVDGQLEEQTLVREVEDLGPFRSKKEAKEAVAELGVQVIREVTSQSRNASGANASVMRSDITYTDGVEARAKPDLPQENCVGLLHAFCLAHNLPVPAYQIYTVSLHVFACQVTVDIPSQDQGNDVSEQRQFGSRSRLIGSKKAAKMAAAKAAVAHLRSVGLMDSSGEAMRKKPRVKSPLSSNGSVTGASEDWGVSNLENVPPGLSPPRASRAQHSQSPSPPAVEGSTPVARAHALRLQLGLSNMEYRMVVQPNTAFYSGAAYFPDEVRASGLRGPLGEVSLVYGRKNAKDEVARGVVKVLEAMLEKRLALI